MSLKTQIIIKRDSISMADDCMDNTQIIDISTHSDIYKMIMDLAKKYLPNVKGNGHSWNCYIYGQKIATINGNCNEIITTAEDISFANGVELYFKYNSANH